MTDETATLGSTPGLPSADALEKIEAAVRETVPGAAGDALVARIAATMAEMEESDIGLAAENARLQYDAEQLARTDPLTGLRNRACFLEDLKREFVASQRYETQLSLLLADVDDLRGVNTEHGYDAGDRLLLEIADLLIKNIRVSDLAARVGDDDFAILLPHTGADGARALARRLSGLLGPQVCIGLATLGAEVTSGAALLDLADRDLAVRKTDRAA